MQISIPPVVDAEVSLDVVGAGLEEVAHLEVGLAGLEVGLDLAVGVVDDGQEHVLQKSFKVQDKGQKIVFKAYQEDEEDEENVGEEVDGPEDGVGLLDVPEVEVTEDHPEERVDGVDEGAEVVDLGAEEQVAELDKGREDDEEHHGEAGEIFGGLERQRERIGFVQDQGYWDHSRHPGCWRAASWSC